MTWKFTDELSVTFQSFVSGPGEFGLSGLLFIKMVQETNFYVHYTSKDLVCMYVASCYSLFHESSTLPFKSRKQTLSNAAGCCTLYQNISFYSIMGLIIYSHYRSIIRADDQAHICQNINHVHESSRHYVRHPISRGTIRCVPENNDTCDVYEFLEYIP